MGVRSWSGEVHCQDTADDCRICLNVHLRWRDPLSTERTLSLVHRTKRLRGDSRILRFGIPATNLYRRCPATGLDQLTCSRDSVVLEYRFVILTARLYPKLKFTPN